MRITWPTLLILAGLSCTAYSESDHDDSDSAEKKNSFQSAMISVEGGVLPASSRFKDTSVASFSLSRTETTWAEWQAVRAYAENHGYELKKAPTNALPDHPVQGISWFDALKWCNAKSEMEGLQPIYTRNGEIYKKGNFIPGVNPHANGYRLPSGTEWEWAARGGLESKGFTYSGGNDLNKVAWNWNNSAGAKQDMSDGRGTWPVSHKEANELGFHDMSGNVAEWSGDEANGPFRGIRGGAWYGAASDCAVNHTNFSSAELGYDFIGFRTARGGKIQVSAASSPLVFSTNTALPSGKTGAPYNAELQSQGGVAPIYFAVKKNTPLPAGLTLSNGKISGTPTTSGSFAFSVLAEDSNPALRSTTEQSFTLEIASYGLEISSDPAMISAKVQEPVSVAFTATGGEPPFKWSAADGLPRGLSLDAATGLLIGTPSRPESTSIAIRVTDSKGFPATRLVPVSITTDPLQFSQAHPPSVMTGVDFLWQLEAKGGVPPYKFSLAPDSKLPSGLYLSTYNPPGRILGKSRSEGPHTFKVLVTDSLAQTAEQEFTLNILPYDLAIADIPTPLEGRYAEPLTHALHATGGVPPLTWSTISDLPKGITLNPSTGSIQGIPLTAGSFDVVIKVTDSNFKSVTKNATFRIAVDPVAITTSSLPPAKAGTPYIAEIATTGGVLPVALSVKSGNELPAGLTLAKGKISGTPSAAGSFSFTIVAQDSNSSAKSQSEQTFNLEIASYGMEINSEPSIISGKVKEPVSAQFTATGGEPPYKWSATGDLPRGLSINATTGVFGGIPSNLASSTITIRVTDSKGFPVMRSIPISITADPLAIASDAPSVSMVGADFLWQVPVKGGLPPYKVELAPGSKLPPGLFLSEYAPHGRIMGEPSATGSFTFKVIAKDTLGQQVEEEATITVIPYDLAIADIAPIEAKYNEPLKISPSATGGVSPLAWSIQGAVPKGLTINATNGEITGAPMNAGTFDFAVKVTDAKRKSVTTNASLRITSDPLSITTSVLPTTKAGVPFNAEITTSGGILPVNLSLKSGDKLPPGLTLGKGRISGTPSAAGSFTFTITAEDSNAASKSKIEQTYSLEIQSYGMEIAPEPVLVSGKVKEPLSVTFTATGGQPPYKWSTTGDMPRGLSIDASTGVLSGTPGELKTGTIMIRVSDATGFPSTRSIPVSITTDPLEIIHEPSPEARPGVDFKWSFQLKGGLSPRPIKLASESTLPPGLYLSFNGTSARIQGKPRSEGAFNFTLIAEDAGSEPVKKDLVLVIPSTPLEIAESPLPVAITTQSLPPARLGTPYSQVIETSGGLPPLKLALKPESQLPPGLLLVKEKLTGTPSAVGNHTFTLTATDIQASSAEATFTLMVSDKPMQIAGPKNAKGEEFKPFTAELRVKGGKAPYTWSTRDPLPAGLTMNASTGVLSGQPAKGTAGNYSVAVQVSDAEGQTAAGLFAFTIAAGESLTILEKTLPTAILNTAYSAKPTAKGGNPTTLKWILESGKLPPGLSLNASTGEISGIPTQAGTAEIVLKVEDSHGNTRIQLFPITVGVDFNPSMVFVLGGKLPAISPLGEQAVADFYLSRYELTWGEWKKTRSTASAKGYDIAEAGQGSADDHPVHSVTWYDAVKWCNLKSENEGLTPVYTVGGATYKTGNQPPQANPQATGYRLPTEIEWEWAARGGVSSKASNFSGANELDAVAWHVGNASSGETSPVGAKQANELGLQDMSGNVQEWCWDSYKNYRRVRGGSMKDDSFACTITNTDFTIPERASQNTGFRPARNFKK
jgi:formylglycine-generating enzyme required for sulfatase activity